ncbi:hypothetical protein FRC07_001777, partial [Ceratobasidium sp. 392]
QSRHALTKAHTFNRAPPATWLDQVAISPQTALVLIPYALHALALSLLLFTAAHVQIALRVLPVATPWAAWAGAALVMKGAKGHIDMRQGNITGTHGQFTGLLEFTEKEYVPDSRFKTSGSWWTIASHLWIGWSLVWLFVSSILWLAFLPPA